MKKNNPNCPQDEEKKQLIDAYETSIKIQELNGRDGSTQQLSEHGFHFYSTLIYAC